MYACANDLNRRAPLSDDRAGRKKPLSRVRAILYYTRRRAKKWEGRVLGKAEKALDSSQSAAETRDLQSGSERTKRGAWVNAVLPFNIAMGPVGTLIQLLILSLHGTVIDVGLAVTLANAISVPSAIVWGFVTDRSHRRKAIIVVSYLVTTGVLVSFLFATTAYVVSLLYGLFAFVSSASTTPLNLLIMETERKQKWATAFARFSMITSIGNTVGLMLSVVWGFFFSLSFLVLVLAILTVVSAVLAVLMIQEPA